MYRLEALAKERGLAADELLRLRQRKTKPLLKALLKWAKTLYIPEPESLVKAFRSIIEREDGLLRFVDDPLLSPDNNDTERAVRGVAVGRKNHYGSRSVEGTKTAALMYNLVESAQLAGVDPGRYQRVTLAAALDGQEIPLPHELVPAPQLADD